MQSNGTQNKNLCAFIGGVKATSKLPEKYFFRRNFFMSETRSGRSTLTELCNMFMTRLLAAETINVPFTAKKSGGGGISRNRGL